MLKDLAGKYYFDQNYNCAETLLHAANEYYGLGLTEENMKLVAVFGAGIQTGNVCGAILSSAAVFSLKYVETKAHESEEIKPATILLTRRFNEAFDQTLLCKEIKARYFNKENRCWATVEIACDVLEKTIEEYERERAN